MSFCPFSVDHCIVYPSSIYGFWLPLWYLLTIVLCILLPFTASDYPFGICWPLYCVSFFHLRLLITPLVSVDHCIVYPSSIYGFWLPLWYLLTIVLCILPFTASDYPFGICWPLYCVSFFHLRLLITPLVSVDHCIVYPSSIYGFWLPLWYLLTIVLCILLPFTASDYPFGICWPLYCVSFFHLRFWLLLWYLLTIVLCILLPFTASDYPLGICWPLYCVSFFHLRLLITPLVSVDHCIVYPSSIYGFWLPLWYLLTIVLCILLPFTASDYPFGICWPLYCVSFFHLRLLITPLVSVDHCIVYPSSIYGFWLPLWYLLTIVLCILLPFTASDYPFGICWPLYCVSFFHLRLLITSLVSVDHCIVYPSSIYGFWLPLWYLLTIVLCILLPFTASDYPFGICWPLYCVSFFHLRLLITPLVSVDHCIVYPSSIYGFWLPLWYLLTIVLCILLPFTASDYPFGICWPLYCVSFFHLRFWLPLWYLLTIVLCILLPFTASDYPFGICWPLYCVSFFHLRLLITPLVSVDHCIVYPSSIYGFWLSLWYLLTIVLCILLPFTASDYPFGICWPLYCVSFFWLPLWYLLTIVLCILLLITPLVSVDHCIVYPSSTYGFWLLLWYLLTIVLCILLPFKASDYPFGICWPLYCVSFFHLRLLITPLVSVDHCIVDPSSIYGFWLPLWYLLTIVLCILLPFTASDYPFGICWPLYCVSFFHLRLLITPLVSVDHCIVYPSSIYGFWLPLWYLLTIVLCILLPFTASDYPFGICWPLYCVSFFHLRLLITPLVSVDHCIVYSSSIYGFWLPLWYLLTIVLCILLPFTASDYTFGICWPLYCVSYFHLRLLITPLVSVDHCIVYPSSIYASDYPFGICWPLYCVSFFHLRLLITPLVSVDHCIVYPSSIYGFWLPLWYLLTIVLCILLPFTASDYPFGICWPLYCVSFFHLRLLITPLVSADHCIVYPSSIYGFWLPIWYLLTIVLCILLPFTASDYPFGICWPLYCVSFFHLRLLITHLVSIDHCIVYPSSIYGFWLPLWYLLTIVLCILLLITPLVSVDHCIVYPSSDYPFGICWPLHCVSFFHLRLLITPLVSVDHCIVYPSSIYGFWLPLWYLLTIVLCILLPFTASDYPFCICWSLYCVSFFHLRLLITPLVSVDHCIVYPSSIYGFWLPIWYLLTIVLCILLPFTASHYSFGICWPLYCVSFFHLRLLITHLVSVDHCIVYPSSIYGFWLLLWYLLTIVLCILLPFTASDYPFGICWPLYCVSFFHLRLLITPLVSVDHCIVYPSSIYGFWLPLWYLLTIVLCILLPFTASDYPFGICWPLYCVSFFHLRLLITPLVSVDHCIVYPSSIYGFWLPLWYLLTIVLCILLPFTASDYPFGICWPLYCVSFFHLRFLITALVSVDHCIVYPSSIYGFWLPLWYLLTIVLCILLPFTASDYPFGICWPLYCVSFFHLRLLITPLVSIDHCIVYPSSIYGFWLPLWYLLTIVLCILLLITPLVSVDHCIVYPSSDYPFGICWPLHCVSFFHLRLLITPLVSVDHCIVYPSSIYGFWLPLWYLLTIVLCILLPFTASDYPFGICWPLYCVSFFHLRLLITPLVFVDHCIVYPSSIYGFWLPLWYLLTIVLCILLPITASDYPFGIFNLSCK